MFEKSKRKAKTILFLVGAAVTMRPASLFAQNIDLSPTLQKFFDAAMKESRPGSNDSDLDKCLQRAVDEFKLERTPGKAPEHIGKGIIPEGDVSISCVISNDAKNNPNFPGVIIYFLRPKPVFMFTALHILPDGEIYPSLSFNVDDNAITGQTESILRKKAVAAYDKAIKKAPERPSQPGEPIHYGSPEPKKP